MLATDFWPTPPEHFVGPCHELPVHLLVEGTEETEDLDNVEGGLGIEIDGLELLH